MVSKEGINVDLANIDSIHYCYMPTSITKVYSFIGLASYFIRSVEGFSTIAVPLNFFTHKDVTFVWSEESEMRFWKLKELFITTIILTLPVGGKGFFVYYCYASYFFIRSVHHYLVDVSPGNEILF